MRLQRIILAVTLVSLIGTAFGQNTRIMEFGVGYLNPKGTEPGLLLNGSYGVSFDERVDFSLGVGFFHRNYTKETAVADTAFQSGINETTVQRLLEYTTTILPVSANVNVRIPFQPPVYWIFGAGLSYQFLFNTEHNFEDDIKEKRNYKGWGWTARAGIEYLLGSRSSIVIEAIYNHAKVKGNEDKSLGLPVWNEVNITGLGIRAGLRLEFY